MMTTQIINANKFSFKKYCLEPKLIENIEN